MKDRLVAGAFYAGLALLGIVFAIGFPLAFVVFVAYLISGATGIPMSWLLLGGATIVVLLNLAKLFR